MALGAIKGMLLRIFSILSSPWSCGHCGLTEHDSFTMGDFGFWFNTTLFNVCFVP